MKKHLRFIIFLTLFGLFLAPGAFSHPYDEPLTFRKHLTNDGRVIYSNIQKKCFSDGKLTCLKYHPIWKGGFLTPAESHDDNANKSSDIKSGS